MINFLKPIKVGNRYTYNDKTIVVDSIELKNIKWYYLLEWWQTQPKNVNIHIMPWKTFILKMKKYKFG